MKKKTLPALPKLLRPMPPAAVVDQLFSTAFAPAPELAEWVKTTFLDEGGPLYNEEHQHLRDADIGFLWASDGFVKAQRTILGQCEDLGLTLRGNSWGKVRGQYQMEGWFDRVPAFLITLSGRYATQCTDAEFCMLVEHELCHICHLEGVNGLRWHDDGTPILGIKGHDVEEFVSIVRRYGVGGPESAVRAMVLAAAGKPEVAGVNIARACGTCLLRAVG